MTKDGPLRRGKPETRTNWQRAKDDFNKAKGDTLVSERVVECPTCGAPMVKQVAKKKPEHVRVVLTCSNDPGHNDERYGYSERWG